MDERKLRRLLRATHPPSDRAGRRCLNETELAAYADDRVSADERARIESHLSDCDTCLGHVAFLARLPMSMPGQVVPPDLLSRARGLGTSRQRPWLTPVLRWSSVAAAASLVLAVGLRFHQPVTTPRTDTPRAAAQPVPEAPPEQPAAALPPATVTPAPRVPPRATVRKSPVPTIEVVVVSPQENATLAASGLDVTWRPVPDALYYDVHVVTEDGTVVWQSKASETSTRLSGNEPLRAGAKYFLWVRAFLASGGMVRSTAVSFRVGGS